MADTKDPTQNSYDTTASEYAAQTAALHPAEYAEAFLARIPPKGTILDLGCGPGRDARVFSERGYNVTGVDISPEMVRLASQAAPSAHFYVMNMTALAFPPHFFDGIWAGASLLHLPKKLIPQVLHQLKTLLKPSGTLYLSVKEGVGEQMVSDIRYGGCPKFWSYFQQEELHGLLIQAGFQVIDISYEPKLPNTYESHPIIRVFAQYRTY